LGLGSTCKSAHAEEWQKLLAIVQHIDVSTYDMCIIHACLQFCAFGNSIKLYNLLVLVIRVVVVLVRLIVRSHMEIV
jgi:hypothetical protein